MAKRRKYKQGIYRPRHPEKFQGAGPCIFRSSYELRFMKWCDTNTNVLEWTSESIIVPYMRPTDGRIHRYFVDNTVKLKSPDGTIHNYLVEIKPYKETLPPVKTPRKRHNTLIKENYRYVINTAKWEAAKKYADKNGYKFIIITEKDLKSVK